MCVYGMMCMHMAVYAYGCVCIRWLGVCTSIQIVCMCREVVCMNKIMGVYACGCACIWGLCICMYVSCI